MEIDDISYEQQAIETEQAMVDTEHQAGDWQDLYSLEAPGKPLRTKSYGEYDK